MLEKYIRDVLNTFLALFDHCEAILKVFSTTLADPAHQYILKV